MSESVGKYTDRMRREDFASQSYCANGVMKRRDFSSVYMGLTLGACLLQAYVPASLRSVEAENARQASPSQSGQELSRLNQQENALLGGDKQTPQKTIEGLSNQIQVMQKQQDKLVEELLRYRRLARDGKKMESAVPPLNDEESASTSASKQAEAALREEMAKRQKALEDENAALRAEIEKSKRQIVEQQQKIQDQEQLVSGIPSLRRQLQEAKNQLLMKQTEMQVLGKAGTQPNIVSSSPPKTAMNDAAKQKILDEVMERSGRIAGEESVSGKRAAEVLVFEVRGVKVNLRSGPGADHAAVMQVQRGSKLTVESREGDWYRVYTPTGTRAYIMADAVVPVSPDGEGPRGSVSAGAVQEGVESNVPGVKRPGKQVARAALDDSLEPFGNVSVPNGGGERSSRGAAAKPKDDFDRAFQRLKKGPAHSGPEQE